MRLGLIGALFLFSGCTSQLLFDKPGMAPGSGQGDLTDCQVEALNKVPANNVTRVINSGPVSTFGSCSGTICSATSYGGGASSYTIDRNEALRERVMIQCMAKKGYTLRQ